MTLVEFLLARIAEDEADAAGIDAHRVYEHPRWTETRVLAECAAKRRIVKRLSKPLPPDVAFHARYVLHALAAVYAEHPDYRPEWRD